MLDEFFLGNSINEQNITNWRQGGYQEWLVGRDAKSVVNQMREEAMCLNSEALVGGGPITDTLATVIAARYATIVAKSGCQPTGRCEPGTQSVPQYLPRYWGSSQGDHTAARLRQREARLVMDAVHKKDHIVTQFRKWMSQDKLWHIWGEEYDPNGLPPEDLDPNSPSYIKPPEGVAPENQGKSNQIKPDSRLTASAAD